MKQKIDSNWADQLCPINIIEAGDRKFFSVS